MSATRAEKRLPGLLETEKVVDLTSAEFFAMIEAHLFDPERPVFLRDGRLCEKTYLPIDPEDIPPDKRLPGLFETEKVVDLTSAEFFAMIEAGVFPPERQVFLWKGRLCEKMAKTVSHWATAYKIAEVLRPDLAPDWLVVPENPVQLENDVAPLPDVVVVRGPLDRYIQENKHPTAADVGLIVEVAVTSRSRDLGPRALMFAGALVPNYWVADVLGRRLVTHQNPRMLDGVPSYEVVQSFGPGSAVELILDGRPIGRWPVATLLPGVAGA